MRISADPEEPHGSPSDAGVFLCFLCSVLLATNEECLTSEGLWAATSKTSTLYLPVIYLNPTKQITAEGIYQCFISLAAASTERITLTITIIVATVVVPLSWCCFLPGHYGQVVSELVNWLWQRPRSPLPATELKSEYETMRLFWLINQRPEKSVLLLTLNNCLHCSFLVMQRCGLWAAGAQTGGSDIKNILVLAWIWLLGILIPPPLQSIALSSGCPEQSWAQREESYLTFVFNGHCLRPLCTFFTCFPSAP